MTVCAIQVDRIDEGQYRASCHLLPGYEILADSEEAARNAMQEAIGLFFSAEADGRAEDL